MTKELIHTVAIILAAGVVLTGIIAALGGPGAVGSENPRTIDVSGQATRMVAPDEAVITFSVVTEAESADQARSDNAALMETVMEAIDDYGETETQYFSVSPVYQDYIYRAEEPRDPRIQFYRATNSVQLTLTDLDSVGEAIDAGSKAGANRVTGVNFQLSDEQRDAIRVELLGEAGENARLKADAIANGLDLRVGNVQTVSESNVYFPGPVYRSYAMADSAEESATTPVSPGELEVRANVGVSYLIR